MKNTGIPNPKKMFMTPLGCAIAAESKVLKDANDWVASVKDYMIDDHTCANKAVSNLAMIRGISYENLNQIQHEHLILLTRNYLAGLDKKLNDLEWYWNPRQTGGGGEPDLQGNRNGEIIISVEVTTSANPNGTILKQMKKTLEKLSTFGGELYYSVRTEKMKAVAEKYIKENEYPITVLLFTHSL